MDDKFIAGVIEEANFSHDSESEDLVAWLFDRTPITEEILIEERFTQLPLRDFQRDNCNMFNHEGRWLLITDMIRETEVRTIGDLRRAMTIGKEW